MPLRLAILAFFLLVPLAPGWTGNAAPGPAGGPTCSLRHITPLLAPAGNAIVLAPIEDTPELLYRSNIKTVGSLYQHGVPGYLRARAAWRSPAGSAPPADVTATFILFCHNNAPYAPVLGAPPNALWNELNAGTPPPWLTLRASDPTTGWQLFVVR